MLLSVENLRVGFGPLEPLDDVSLSLNKGEILGLVGESGSGKSLCAMTIMGLLGLLHGKVLNGSIRFNGKELTRLNDRAYRHLRGGSIALITQNPMSSLDPVIRVGRQIDQSALLHLDVSHQEARALTLALMERLRIPEAARVYDLYPHELSGGMCQRIVIAMALIAKPEVLIADEPTTALDVTVQAQIVHLLAEIVQERGLGLILITHDMSLVAQTCDRIAVIYCGRVVELGRVDALFGAPQHPYTQALIACIPRDGMAENSLTGIAGVVPSVANLPTGCRFHPRCPVRMDICTTRVPALVVGADNHAVACHLSRTTST